jgi:ribA/ribD-fused uncharacterized protein
MEAYNKIDKIEFYNEKNDFGCFSNFSPHIVEYKKVLYPTSEHAFQALKFKGTDNPYMKLIVKCKTPSEAKRLGSSRKHPIRPDWEEIKDDLMTDILYSKFSQNDQIKKVLLDTLDKTLVEHTKNDSYWGDGGNGNGRNQLGKCLMIVRSKLLNEKIDN